MQAHAGIRAAACDVLCDWLSPTNLCPSPPSSSRLIPTLPTHTHTHCPPSSCSPCTCHPPALLPLIMLTLHLPPTCTAPTHYAHLAPATHLRACMQGEWAADKFQGQGVLTLPRYGRTYRGQFLSGQPDKLPQRVGCFWYPPDDPKKAAAPPKKPAGGKEGEAPPLPVCVGPVCGASIA